MASALSGPEAGTSFCPSTSRLVLGAVFGQCLVPLVHDGHGNYCKLELKHCKRLHQSFRLSPSVQSEDVVVEMRRRAWRRASWRRSTAKGQRSLRTQSNVDSGFPGANRRVEGMDAYYVYHVPLLRLWPTLANPFLTILIWPILATPIFPCQFGPKPIWANPTNPFWGQPGGREAQTQRKWWPEGFGAERFGSAGVSHDSPSPSVHI